MSKAWMMLIAAGILEIAWTVGIKYSQGFTRMIPSLLTGGALSLSMYLLAKATKDLPIGTAYAVWVGIGALGAAIMGIILFKEPATPARIFFLILLLTSIIGLKVTSP